ncbi:hypothetical protein JOQ06_016533 [Pogonophryne albipinna]|uniref:Uncharacterized protein n=2 Tax=Pogonophryne albipinna TaxID=1090488 RepID=A0AAD6F4Y0_9TELE|nr:hypothetical protein JOQ06_016533 [Pogonophryne albipinna]
MYIHKQTEFGGDQIHGYVDIGSGEIENVIATQALVLMVVAINESWKIPIAYFLINSMTGTERANLIRESLVRLHAIGVRVISLTCDGPSQNFAMIRELGAKLDIFDMRSFFLHPEDHTQKIYVILDPCHMLKLLRNVFSTVGVLVREDGQQIMWKYIEELHKLQEKEGLRLGNKLKMAHIQWRNQKMKVNLAAQLFSSSVADALEYSEKELKYPQFTGSAATVQFLRTIDAAFDVLNSRNPLGRGHKAPIKPATKHRAIGILLEAESLLRGLKMKGKDNKLVPLHATQKKTPICGFIACGRSVIGIYEDLVEQPAAPCRYLLTYKLSQDHLELFFSAIRARGGYNNNPNVRQFRGAYKRLLVRHQVKKGTGNCLLRDNTTILDSTLANINMARRLGIEPVEEIVTEDDTLANLPDVNHLSEYKEAAISYIAGFIVKKIEQKVTCMPCSHALTSADSVHPFVTLKNRGGLQKPSPGIASVCQVTERCFQRLLNANEGKAPQGRGTTAAIVHQVLSECSEKNLFPQLHNHMFDMTTGTVQNHPTFTKDVILLPHPEWDAVYKHKTKRRLHQKGFILNAFEMKKIWDCRTVIAELREAFKDNIPEGVSIELLMPCGNKLVSPKLREGQELNGFLIHKVFKSKAVYIRPSSMLQNTLDSSDSEDGMMADTQSTSSEQHISTQATPDCVTRARGNQIASTPLVSSYPFTRSGRANRAGAEQQSSSGRITTETQASAVEQESSGSMARETQRSAVEQESSGSMARETQRSAVEQESSGSMARETQRSAVEQESSGSMARETQRSAVEQESSGSMARETQRSAVEQESSGSMARETQRSAVEQESSGSMARETQRSAVDDYTTYLSIMPSISDHSSDDEELNQAIMASLQSHM